MTIGELLDGAFTIYRNHFLAFVVTSLVLLAPTVLLVPVSPLIATSVRLFAGVLISGALIHLSSEAVLGHRPRVGDGLAAAFRHLLPLLVGTVCYVPLLIAGFVCLVAPGFCLLCMWFAWQPIIVIERRWDFFARSRLLARDQWGKIALVTFTAYVIAVLPGLALSLSTMSLLNIGYTAASRSPAVIIGGVVTSILVAPFSNAVITLLYYDQRIRKEGFDVELAVAAAGTEANERPASPAAGR